MQEVQKTYDLLKEKKNLKYLDLSKYINCERVKIIK